MFSAVPAYVPLSNGNLSRRSNHEKDRHPALEGKPLLSERLIPWYQITIVFAIASILEAMSSNLATSAAPFFSSGNGNGCLYVGYFFLLMEVMMKWIHANMLVPTETVYFRMNQSFMQATSKDSDRLWQSLIPGLGGRRAFQSHLLEAP